MDSIQVQFPELVNIDERIWNEVCQDAHFYQRITAYILLDLQQSYQICWRIQMTKRCAQMLLKYESTAVTELYETGMLGETEYSHILELIEKKLFDLEFYRVKMPKGQPKAIEDAFESLLIFRSLPDSERATWAATMKSNHKWFQPGEMLLEKDHTASVAYLIARGVVECQVNTLPTFYRAGNIVGIDSLFSETLPLSGTYTVCGGLVEAYCINATLLNQLLDDENLAPSLYREIALHALSNNFKDQLKLNRSQVKLLLQTRAKLYRKQHELPIRLAENERMFLLAGNVTELSMGQNQSYDSIQFKIFNKSTEILLNSSTLIYTWTYKDELHCIKNKNIQDQFPMRIFGSIQNDLSYPGYSSDITGSAGRHHSVELLRYVENFKNVQEAPSEKHIILEHKF